MNAIEVQNLSKIYGTQCVVDALSMTVPRGSVFGFLGPNGSGKTTTIRMISGLVTPDSGSGQCLGYDILSERESIKQHIGYMPQKFSYYPELTVSENLLFIADVMNISHPKERIEHLIETHHLKAFRHRPAGLLSGGWKQRVSLVCALLHDPELLLLDEPTASVDPGSRREFWDAIADISHLGKTVLVSTHLMDETARCTHLAYLLYGHLIACGTPKTLIESTQLSSLAISDPKLDELRRILKARFAPMHLSIFGDSLHITDQDPARLSAIQDYCAQQGIEARYIPVSVEDVFIHFMERSSRG